MVAPFTMSPRTTRGRLRRRRTVPCAVTRSAAPAADAVCPLGPIWQHESYEGSPASQGVLQFDMWGVTPSDRWDWAVLRAKIAQHGLRNSLLVAPMPTASTAQILGNNECFEPYTSNLYARRTLAGEFFVLNPHLQRELQVRQLAHYHSPTSRFGHTRSTSRLARALLAPLCPCPIAPHCTAQALGLWSRATRDAIMAAGGSVQGLTELPQELRDVFKTAWEMRQRNLIDMAADRGAFIDQSQSLNLFVAVRTSTPSRYPFCKHYYLCHSPTPPPPPPPPLNEDDLVLLRHAPASPACPGTHLRPALVDALPRLEARPQDGHVLPAHAASDGGDQVHIGQVRRCRERRGRRGGGRGRPTDDGRRVLDPQPRRVRDVQRLRNTRARVCDAPVAVRHWPLHPAHGAPGRCATAVDAASVHLHAAGTDRSWTRTGWMRVSYNWLHFRMESEQQRVRPGTQCAACVPTVEYGGKA